MITKMTKFSFILLSSEADAFLEKLQELGVVDITRSKKPVDAASSSMMEKAAKIRKVISMLEKTDFTKDADHEAICKAAAETALPEDLVAGTLETAADIERLKAQADAAVREAAARKPWGEFDPKTVDRLKGCMTSEKRVVGILKAAKKLDDYDNAVEADMTFADNMYIR